jgi:hypothetical protein
LSREKSDVLELLPHIQALLADFTGRKISINITEVQAKHIEKRVQYLLTSFTDLVQRTTATSDENKKKEYLKRFLEVFGEFFFHIPPCEQSVNRLIEQISEPFNLENRKFFTNTRFLVYKNSMFSIIDRIARRKKYPEFRNLVNTISKEDLIIMAQHTISINQKASFLLNEHKRLTGKKS